MMENRLIDIIIPTLGRSQLLVPLVDSIRRHTKIGLYGVVFVIDHEDQSTLKLLSDTLVGRDVTHIKHNHGFIRKANEAVSKTDSEWILLCGDDVLFHAGWWEATEQARREADVIGTNDLTPRTRNRDHATAQLVRRSYVEDPGAVFGRPGEIMWPGYHHNFADDELCQLAQYRGRWQFIDGSHIEHMHPAWGTRPEDHTDSLGAFSNFEIDKRRHRMRRRLWMRASRS